MTQPSISGKTADKALRVGVVVLGMHRSGTSLLAGLLGQLGCDLPANLMQGTDRNPKGYFESRALYLMHKELLDSAASRWDDWQPIWPNWFKSPRAGEFHDKAVELTAQEYGASRLLVLKDPRICRLVPFWKDVFADSGITPRFVLTLRNPFEVVASLNSRDQISTDHGLLIWLRHNLQAEADTRGDKRSFVSYAQTMNNWVWVAEKMQNNLDLFFPKMNASITPKVSDFLSHDLRHFTVPDDRILKDYLVSGWIRDSYEILNRWTESGEDPSDYPILDRVRTELDHSAAVFAPIVDVAHNQSVLAAKWRGESERLLQEKKAVDAVVSEQEKKLAALKTAHEEKVSQLRGGR